MTNADTERGDSTLDRAAWQRFNKRGERCLVCGARAVISLSLVASELGAKGSQLASEKTQFCQTHGMMRYAEAVGKVNGTGKA